MIDSPPLDRDDVRYSQSISMHIPIEVFENVIEMLYSGNNIQDQLVHVGALRSCSLVCRAWRPRAQMMLFSAVILDNVSSLYKLASTLDDAPHLSSYVRDLHLTGRSLHTGTSLLALFPSVLGSKALNLRRLDVRHILDSTAWYPDASKATKEKQLPCLPLHPIFPRQLSFFRAITDLHLEAITFPNFGDFARMITVLPNLHTLGCLGVQWITLGTLPMCMRLGEGPRASSRSFAFRLRDLRVCSPHLFYAILTTVWDKVYHLGLHGTERLISACGPRLTRIAITIPYCDVPSESEPSGE